MFLDNRQNGLVGDALELNISSGAKLSIRSEIVSIYAYYSLKEKLHNIDSLRLLLSLPYSKETNLINCSLLTGDESENTFKNKLMQAQVAGEFLKWLEEKVDCKLIPEQLLTQNLYHIQNSEEAFLLQGNSMLTTAGLGYSQTDKLFMNTIIKDEDATNSILLWFDNLWNNNASVNDFNEEIKAYIKLLIEKKAPELIYFFTIQRVFNNLLDELSEDKIIKTKTGIKDSIVWNKLYKFQRDGVMGAIDKLEKFNGCIIADSVGLGKTFEALAVIKYYELRNDRVLVLCPKKLRDNWTMYKINDKRNIFLKDRLNYDVLNHTDLTRDGGKSGEINLETLNWENYDLVVIDESHNFRNNNAKIGKVSRYTRLMNDIIRKGVKTKILMLSATPVNNRMNDLKNQVAFITEGLDDALIDVGISSIELTLKEAQRKFNIWLALDEEDRNANKLIEMMRFDYFKLLDTLTIARSRKHIEKYYDSSDIGEFSDRLKPVNIKSEIDTENQFPPILEINRNIRRMNLSSYAPLKYVLKHKKDEYSKKYDIEVQSGVFTQVDRENSLIHLMRVNLLKRMESSMHSFALTVNHLLSEVNRLIRAIDDHQDSIEEQAINIEDLDLDDEEFNPMLVGSKKIKVLLKDIDKIKWRQELEEDKDQLKRILREAQVVSLERVKKNQNGSQLDKSHLNIL